MKNSNTLLKLCLAVLFISLFSCSNDDNGGGPTGPVNTADLKLFVIDTAKVNTISVTSTNEVTILNKRVNSSSYIGDFCISPDGKKIIYVNNQQTGVYPNLVSVREIRIANNDGSGDAKIYEELDNNTYIGTIRYCNDNKIVFSTLTYQGAFITAQVHEMNNDGTGLIEVHYAPNFEDVSADKGFYLVNTDTSVTIYDADADNGTPGLYHTETISTAESINGGTFTNDGKLAVVPYKEGNSIKAKVIDMATKTSNTVDLITNLSAGWYFYHLAMTSDSKRGIITVSSSDNTKSKSYIFDIKTGVVQAPFENNDENVSQVYAW